MKTSKQIRKRMQDPMFVESLFAWAFVAFSVMMIIKTW